jgi:uncharacterized repeat protein (TIGR01451 family)
MRRLHRLVGTMALVPFLAACTGGARSTAVRSTTATGVRLSSVDWSAATAPQLGCTPGLPPPQADVFQVSYVRPRPDTREAIVLAKCHDGASNPEALFAYDRAVSRTRPHLAQVLLDPGLDRGASAFSVRGSTISMTVSGYSSAAVADCCADLRYIVRWTWVAGADRGSRAGATGPDPLALSVNASPASVAVGHNLTFTLLVANRGPSPLTSLEVDDLIQTANSSEPLTAKMTSWTSPSMHCGLPPAAPLAVSCTLVTLKPGASVQATFILRVPAIASPLVNGVNGLADSSFGRVRASARTSTTVHQ